MAACDVSFDLNHHYNKTLFNHATEVGRWKSSAVQFTVAKWLAEAEPPNSSKNYTEQYTQKWASNWQWTTVMKKYFLCFSSENQFMIKLIEK